MNDSNEFLRDLCRLDLSFSIKENSNTLKNMDDILIRKINGPLRPPTKFQRKVRSNMSFSGSTNSSQETKSCRQNRLLKNYTNWKSADDVWFMEEENTYSNHPLLSDHRENCVVAPGPSSSGINKDMNGVVEGNRGRRLREHHIQIDSPEDLLERVEGEPGQLRLDQIGSVLHDGLQLEMPVAALPPRDQVEHVGAVGGLSVLPALGACEGDAEHVEEGKIRGLVAHLDEARVE